jgi:arabinogalactan endo-1,4-beta-galactosidase
LAKGFDNNLFQWFFDGIKNNGGGKYDIIGMSHYPTLDGANANDWQTKASKNNKNVILNCLECPNWDNNDKFGEKIWKAGDGSGSWNAMGSGRKLPKNDCRFGQKSESIGQKWIGLVKFN